MLLGAYFVAKAGIAAGSAFMAGGSALMAARGIQWLGALARDLMVAGYVVAFVSVLVYVGVLHA